MGGLVSNTDNIDLTGVSLNISPAFEGYIVEMCELSCLGDSKRYNIRAMNTRNRKIYSETISISNTQRYSFHKEFIEEMVKHTLKKMSYVIQNPVLINQKLINMLSKIL